MKINDQNYIQQLKKKNEEALLYVIDRYGALLKAILRKHLFCFPYLQEECFNDILLGIWQNIDSFDESRNSFKNWIAAIARYQAISYIRKYQKELRNVSLENLPLEIEDSPSLAFVEEELNEEVKDLLLHLKPLDQQIFKKLYIEECGVDEVGRELNMKKSAIYNRVSRARKRMFRIYPSKGDC
ncbi:MAG: sigma-70 family RNA polymerase sigma factor [Lachnospiraceae bacterium]|nr:sigma-70 family RNA polymerase sigma factor [Lachnospiraceae bacterium]